MTSNILFTFLAVILCVSACAAYKYIVSVNDDLGPCDTGVPYLDKYVDMSNVKLTKSDDDALIVDGNMTTTFDFPPNNKFVIHSSFFRKERGQWTPLPMKHVIPDFCPVFFSPAEIWYPVADQLVGDARKCPPPKGVNMFRSLNANLFWCTIDVALHLQTVYTVNKAELVGRYEFAKSVEGEYQAQIEITYDTMKVCVQISADLREDVWICVTPSLRTWRPHF